LNRHHGHKNKRLKLTFYGDKFWCRFTKFYSGSYRKQRRG